MEEHSKVFVGVDAAKLRHAVAVAEDGRQGEVRYLGEIGADAEPATAFTGSWLGWATSATSSRRR